jgi:Acetyltransferases
VIEALGSADAASAIALWEEADLTRPWNDAGADFRRAVGADSSAVLGIREDGRLVATAMVGWDGHRGWVYYLAVAKSHRGRGLGRELMTAAERWLKAAGAPKIQFMVRTENDAVLSFYDHLGYIPQYCVVLGRRLD